VYSTCDAGTVSVVRIPARGYFETESHSVVATPYMLRVVRDPIGCMICIECGNKLSLEYDYTL
jgi:hypothetical protein